MVIKPLTPTTTTIAITIATNIINYNNNINHYDADGDNCNSNKYNMCNSNDVRAPFQIVRHFSRETGEHARGLTGSLTRSHGWTEENGQCGIRVQIDKGREKKEGKEKAADGGVRQKKK